MIHKNINQFEYKKKLYKLIKIKTYDTYTLISLYFILKNVAVTQLIFLKKFKNKLLFLK